MWPSSADSGLRSMAASRALPTHSPPSARPTASRTNRARVAAPSDVTPATTRETEQPRVRCGSRSPRRSRNRAQRARHAVGSGRCRALTGRRDPERLDACRTDPGHRIELLDRPKGAVRGAVVDDLLGRHRPHARQLVELLDRGGAQAHRPRGLRALHRRSDSGGRRPRDEHLLPVDQRRSEVDRLQVCLSRSPSRPGQRVGDAGAVLQPVEARLTDGPCHVDDELRPRRLCRSLHAHRDGSRGRGRRRMPEPPDREQQRDRDSENERDRLAP